MPDTLRVIIEEGPKGKKSVAVAWDWPGLARGAKDGRRGAAKLESYVPRYAPVARRTRLGAELGRQGQHVKVVERYGGVGSTDFWGISFASSLDRAPISHADWGRRLRLLQACWAEFDEVAARVTPELRLGPRGGGRDRDGVVRHTLGTERDFAEKVGVKVADGAVLTPARLLDHRTRFIQSLREYHRDGMAARTWTLSFLLRHAAYHVMDHTWEMQDRDLSDS